MKRSDIIWGDGHPQDVHVQAIQMYIKGLDPLSITNGKKLYQLEPNHQLHAGAAKSIDLFTMQPERVEERRLDLWRSSVKFFLTHDSPTAFYKTLFMGNEEIKSKLLSGRNSNADDISTYNYGALELDDILYVALTAEMVRGDKVNEMLITGVQRPYGKDGTFDQSSGSTSILKGKDPVTIYKSPLEVQISNASIHGAFKHITDNEINGGTLLSLASKEMYDRLGMIKGSVGYFVSRGTDILFSQKLDVEGWESELRNYISQRKLPDDPAEKRYVQLLMDEKSINDVIQIATARDLAKWSSGSGNVDKLAVMKWLLADSSEAKYIVGNNAGQQAFIESYIDNALEKPIFARLQRGPKLFSLLPPVYLGNNGMWWSGGGPKGDNPKGIEQLYPLAKEKFTARYHDSFEPTRCCDTLGRTETISTDTTAVDTNVRTPYPLANVILIDDKTGDAYKSKELVPGIKGVVVVFDPLKISNLCVTVPGDYYEVAEPVVPNDFYGIGESGPIGFIWAGRLPPESPYHVERPGC